MIPFPGSPGNFILLLQKHEMFAMSLISPVLYLWLINTGVLDLFHVAAPGKACGGEQDWGEVFWGGVHIYGDQVLCY